MEIKIQHNNLCQAFSGKSFMRTVWIFHVYYYFIRHCPGPYGFQLANIFMSTTFNFTPCDKYITPVYLFRAETFRRSGIWWLQRNKESWEG